MCKADGAVLPTALAEQPCLGKNHCRGVFGSPGALGQRRRMRHCQLLRESCGSGWWALREPETAPASAGQAVGNGLPVPG